MISDNIKELRKQKGLTQKELADLLHVTSQAVSRWENGEVEPSVDTIRSMANIFEVTTDEIIDGPDKKPKPQVVTEVKERIIVEQGKPVLTICEQCKRPIYNSEEIVTKYHHNGRGPTTSSYICIDCDTKNKEKARISQIEHAKEQRTKSYLWGGAIAFFVLIAGVIYLISQPANAISIAIVILLPILSFTFASCMFLENNYIEDLFLSIATWSIRFPGLIFPFSLDGIIWLIGMKILFWIIGAMVSIAVVLLALAVCMPLSAFAYPLALYRSIKYPECTGEV